LFVGSLERVLRVLLGGHIRLHGDEMCHGAGGIAYWRNRETVPKRGPVLTVIEELYRDFTLFPKRRS